MAKITEKKLNVNASNKQKTKEKFSSKKDTNNNVKEILDEIPTFNDIDSVFMQQAQIVVPEQKTDPAIRLLTDISNKLDTIIQENKNKSNLSEMSLSDLSFLNDMLTKNFMRNNYPGGNDGLKISSNNLIVKISEEINNRINEYK